MTGAADFLVDLEAAWQLRLVEHAERAGEAPVLTRRLWLFNLVLRERRWSVRDKERQSGRGKGGELETDHSRVPWDRSPVSRQRPPRLSSSSARRRRSRLGSASSSP